MSAIKTRPGEFSGILALIQMAIGLLVALIKSCSQSSSTQLLMQLTAAAITESYEKRDSRERAVSAERKVMTFLAHRRGIVCAS